MKRLKLLAVLMVVLMCVATMTACRGSSGKPTDPDSVKTDPKDTNVDDPGSKTPEGLPKVAEFAVATVYYPETATEKKEDGVQFIEDNSGKYYLYVLPGFSDYDTSINDYTKSAEGDKDVTIKDVTIDGLKGKSFASTDRNTGSKLAVVLNASSIREGLTLIVEVKPTKENKSPQLSDVDNEEVWKIIENIKFKK